jgi:lipid A 3-O-deacylase
MPRNKDKIVLLLILALVSVPATPAGAGVPDSDKIYDTLSVYWENDVIAGTDRDYTNGLRFTWSTPYRLNPADPRLPKWSSPWLQHLPDVGPGERRAVSFSFGQSIYTPADMGSAEPDVNDRPYAGYSYLAATFHQRTPTVKTSWEFQFGIVGPLSFAEEYQNSTHDLLGNGWAQGWDHQLRNEAGLDLICERHWLLLHAVGDPGLNFDLIPHLGGRLGNIATSVNLGGELRLGWNLPPTFGTCPIRGGCESYSAFNDEGSRPDGKGFEGLHFFVGVDGRAVFHDIFLDGNTWVDSPSVEKEILVADLLVGIALRYDSITATYSYVYRTKEFETQSGPQLFGSLSLAWTY